MMLLDRSKIMQVAQYALKLKFKENPVIAARLEQQLRTSAIEIHNSLSSTNDYMLNLLKNKGICAEELQYINENKAISLKELTVPASAFAKEQAFTRGRTVPIAVLAEEQTAGKGRCGKKWESPFAKNIYLSMYTKFAAFNPRISGLSLVIGIAIAEVLKKIGLPDVMLKWPNDIYCNGAKIAGILLEISSRSNEQPLIDGRQCDLGRTSIQTIKQNTWLDIVIGTGVNISDTKTIQNKVDQPCTDVVAELEAKQSVVDLNPKLANYETKTKTKTEIEAGDKLKVLYEKIDAHAFALYTGHDLFEKNSINDIGLRNFLAALIIAEITFVVEQFKQHGLSIFMERWQELDLLFGRQVTITVNRTEYVGIASGIDVTGAFGLRVDNKIRYFNTGTVRL